MTPNKRLKLPGGDRLKGTGVLCPWRGTDFVPHPSGGASSVSAQSREDTLAMVTAISDVIVHEARRGGDHHGPFVLIESSSFLWGRDCCRTASETLGSRRITRATRLGPDGR